MLSRGPQPRAFVLIIAGSGSSDRDGNSLEGIRASTYRLLAEKPLLILQGLRDNQVGEADARIL